MSHGDSGSRVKVEGQWPPLEGSCSSNVSMVYSVILPVETSQMSWSTVVKMVYFLVHKKSHPLFPDVIVTENPREGSSLGDVVSS